MRCILIAFVLFTLPCLGCSSCGSTPGFTISYTRPPTWSSSVPLATSGQAWGGLPFPQAQQQGGFRQDWDFRQQSSGFDLQESRRLHPPSTMQSVQVDDPCVLLLDRFDRLQASIDRLAGQRMPKGQ